MKGLNYKMHHDKKPDPNSNRTWERANDLAFARGCETWNDCWSDCVETARDQIVEGQLDKQDLWRIKEQQKLRYKKVTP